MEDAACVRATRSGSQEPLARDATLNLRHGSFVTSVNVTPESVGTYVYPHVPMSHSAKSCSRLWAAEQAGIIASGHMTTTLGSVPGHCTTISITTPTGDLAASNEAPRDGPWETEGGILAGWEVELPPRLAGPFGIREMLALTTLPPALAKVMGETEYQEQVAAIRELTDARCGRLLARGIVSLGLIIMVGMVGFFGPILSIPAAFTSLLLGYNFVCFAIVWFAVFAAPIATALILFALSRTRKASKSLASEIALATAHWETRGIAWRVKISDPLAALSSGRHPTVIAGYNWRVCVECAPDAIALFETHGPFPSTGRASSYGFERYSDHSNVGTAHRSSHRLSGGPDGTPKFTLAFSRVFLDRIRLLAPERPMMLRDVIGVDEFAEQVAVINLEMERLTKPWKISVMLLLISALLVGPGIAFSIVPSLAWLLFGLDEHWWIPAAGMVTIFLTPLVGVVICWFAGYKTKQSAEEKFVSFMETIGTKWESRGIEWFLSEEKYRLQFGDHSGDHTERRVTIRVRPEAVDKYEAMGPFPLGSIDGLACVTYDLTAN